MYLIGWIFKPKFLLSIFIKMTLESTLALTECTVDFEGN